MLLCQTRGLLQFVSGAVGGNREGCFITTPHAVLIKMGFGLSVREFCASFAAVKRPVPTVTSISSQPCNPSLLRSGWTLYRHLHASQKIVFTMTVHSPAVPEK